MPLVIIREKRGPIRTAFVIFISGSFWVQIILPGIYRILNTVKAFSKRSNGLAFALLMMTKG